jgi:hypothetical protein
MFLVPSAGNCILYRLGIYKDLPEASDIELRDNESGRASAWHSGRGGGIMAGAMSCGLNPIGFYR